jgi:hypothetical protein
LSTLAQILDEMADIVRGTLDDVTDVDVQVEPRIVLSPTPPTIDMFPTDPSNDQLLAGFADDVGGELITVRARVNTADSDAGQDLLLALMDDEDPLSLIAALNDDPTLNGTASDCAFRGRSGYVIVPDPGGDAAYLGCLFQYVVIKARS